MATLGLSRGNAEMLKRERMMGRIGRLRVLVSNYFSSVDRSGTFLHVRTVLEGLAEIRVARTHAKVLLFLAPPFFFIFEGSANLRSSETVEQIVVFNDRELLEWHREWMREVCGDGGE